VAVVPQLDHWLSWQATPNPDPRFFPHSHLSRREFASHRQRVIELVDSPIAANNTDHSLPPCPSLPFHVGVVL
jgi:hypothetical protein